MKFNCQKVGKTIDGSLEFTLNKKYKLIIIDGYFKIIDRTNKNKIVVDGNDLNVVQEAINALI